MSEETPPKPSGIVESVLGIAWTRIRTFNEFLLAVLIAANIAAVFYALRYALPEAIIQIHAGHREARNDFTATVDKLQQQHDANTKLWIEASRHRDDGFGAVVPTPNATNKAREQAGSE